MELGRGVEGCRGGGGSRARLQQGDRAGLLWNGLDQSGHVDTRWYRKNRRFLPVERERGRERERRRQVTQVDLPMKTRGWTREKKMEEEE